MTALPTDISQQRSVAQPSERILSYDPNAVSRVQEQGASNLQSTADKIQTDATTDQDKTNQIQFVNAQNQLLSAKVSALNTIKDSQDYNSFEPTYQKVMTKAQNDISATIQAPEVKQLFDAHATGEYDTGLETVQNLVREKKVDSGKAWADGTLDMLQTQAVSSPDPETRSLAVNQANATINSAKNSGFYTADQAVEKQIGWAQTYGKNYVDSLSPEDKIKVLAPHPATPSVPVSQVIATAATNNGVDPDFMAKTAALESGGNPFAPQNPNSSAKGLYQITQGTANQFGLKDPTDPVASADVTAKNAKANGVLLQNNLGRPATNSELYLAHQQGGAGASALIANPDQNAVDVLKGIGVSDKTAQASIVNNGGSTDMSAGDFVKKWNDKYNATPGLTNDYNVPVFQKTGTPADFLSASDRLAMYQQAQFAQRTELSQRVQDSTSMAMNGKVDPNPPTLNDFNNAYGLGQGQKEYDRFAPIVQLSSDMKDMATMNPVDINNMLTTRKPVPGLNYAVQQERYKVMTEAATNITKMRTDDPIGYAQQYGLTDNKAIDFSNPANLGPQLQARAQVAQTLNKTYGVPPNTLTDGEAKQFGTIMQSLPATNRLGYLKAMSDSIGDPATYRATMQQIRPDSPVTAMAGMYMNLGKPNTVGAGMIKSGTSYDPTVVAQSLLQGEDLLNPVKDDKNKDGSGKPFPMPSDGKPGGSTMGLRTQFDAATGDAFRNSPQSADQAYQAVRAYYAASASKAGDYSGTYNNKLGADAVNAVMGNIVATNTTTKAPGGGYAIAPWGMDPTTFLDNAKGQFNQIVKDNGFDPGVIRFKDAALENVGPPGQYYLNYGSGYLHTKGGKPVVLDLNKPLHAADQVPTITDPIALPEQFKNNPSTPAAFRKED